MKSSNEADKQYELLVDTLIMISPDFCSMTDDDCDIYLQELEGDYWSFLDPANTTPLVEEGLLSDAQALVISELKATMTNIDPALWRKRFYYNHPDWDAVRIIAESLLASLGVTRRKVD